MNTILRTPPAGTLAISEDGLARLRERMRRLDKEILPALRERLVSPDGDGRDDEALAMALVERARVGWVLATARPSEELPDDPDVVELGDWIMVRDDEGAVEVYRIVDPIEAPMDSVRVSSSSPLAQAALCRRVGDVIEVGPERGERFRLTILASSRRGFDESLPL